MKHRIHFPVCLSLIAGKNTYKNILYNSTYSNYLDMLINTFFFSLYRLKKNTFYQNKLR